MKNLGTNLQESILVALVWSDRLAKKIRNSVPVKLFVSDLHRDIVRRIYEYIDQHKKPPKDHLPDLLDDVTDGKSDKAKLYRQTIRQLHTTSKSLNEQFVEDRLDDFIQVQQAKLSTIQLSEAIQTGDAVEVRAALAKTSEAMKSAKDTGPQVATVRELMKREFVEPQWVIRNLVPLGLMLIVGAPKIGKSWLMLQLAHAKATGGMVLGAYRCKPGGVLVLALEDTEPRLQKRIRRLQHDGTVPKNFYYATSWPALDVGGLERLRNFLEEHPDVQLVIIDTLARIRSAPDRRETNAYQLDYKELTKVKTLADDHKIGIVVLHHLRKQVGFKTDVLERISGTTALAGAADTTMVLERDRDADQGIIYVTGRDVAEQKLSALFDLDVGGWSILGDEIEHRITKDQEPVLKIVRRAGRPIKPHEVAVALGYDEDDEKAQDKLRKMMHRLYEVGRLKQVKTGTYILATPTLFNTYTHEEDGEVSSVSGSASVSALSGMSGMSSRRGSKPGWTNRTPRTYGTRESPIRRLSLRNRPKKLNLIDKREARS